MDVRMHGHGDMDGGEPVFDGGELELLTRRFRAGRREFGARRADARWVDGPFDDWLVQLGAVGPAPRPDGGGDMPDDAPDDASDGVPDGPACCPVCVGLHGAPGGAPLAREHVAAFAVGMHEALPIRDALILSLVAGGVCDKTMMVDFAAAPHAPGTRRMMGRTLSRAFEVGLCRSDLWRCVAGIGMMLRVVSLVPAPMRVQPMAVIAYVLWWLGDDLAAAYAMRCLAQDGDCSLAAIVLALLEQGVTPTWRRAGCPDRE